MFTQNLESIHCVEMPPNVITASLLSPKVCKGSERKIAKSRKNFFSIGFPGCWEVRERVSESIYSGILGRWVRKKCV